MLHLHAAPAGALDPLIAATPWRADSITLFGRRIAQPRLTAWYGDPGAAYRYAGLTLQPLAWTPMLAALRDQAAQIAAAPFNSVLLNYYRNGADSMGLHSDDEPELGPEPVIASLSLGAQRTLLMRHRTDPGQPAARIPLPDRSLLVMRGPTQACWKHGIGKSARPTPARLNLTFRHILPR